MEEKSFGPVRFIPGKNKGRYPYCHSLYIEGPKILIDPASDRERLIRLKEESGVNMIWLSHWHEDHIMDLDLFEDLPLFVSQADSEPLTDLDLFLDAYSMAGEFREAFKELMITRFHYKPRKPDGFLKGGETLELGTVTVDIIATPGHTPGHLAFYFKEPRVLFLGDYDLTRFGPWYGDRDSDVDEVAASVQALKEISADVWLACHETGVFEDPPGTLWEDYLGVIRHREERLLSLLDSPRKMDEIIDAGIVYNRPGTGEHFFRFGEEAIMGKHLQRDIQNGLILRQNDCYVKA